MKGYKSTENYILEKGNNSCKRRSNVTEVNLYLYYVEINSYTKFQVNITKDKIEKSGKLNFAKDNNSSNNNIVATFRGMHVSIAKHSYALLPRKYDYQRVTIGQTDTHKDRRRTK